MGVSLRWAPEHDVWLPHNPFSGRGSVWWGDLAQILRRNANLHAQVRLNFYPRLYSDFVTIMDWHLPEMAMATGAWRPHAGETLGQASGAEYEAFAVVTNCAWLNGEAPLDSLPGELWRDEWGRETARVKRKPHKGVREAVYQAVHMKTLLPSLELGLLLGDNEMIRRNRWRRGIL